MILSLILIWFGIDQWRARFASAAEDLLADPSLDRSPLETGLTAAMTALDASRGLFLWREDGANAKRARSRSATVTRSSLNPSPTPDGPPAPFLYDVAKDRALTRDSERNLLSGRPSDRDRREARGRPRARRRARGSASAPAPARASCSSKTCPTCRPIISTLASRSRADLAAHIQRHALLKAAAESAEARSRLALARDLHDSVVQFLAGAAFRLEAMKRSEASGRTLEPELNELKQLMMQEQGELRAFITALRSGPRVTLDDLARDLEALAERLVEAMDDRLRLSRPSAAS